MMLGTPGGLVDLRTGELHPARREDFITKLTAVAPAATPPDLWLTFLDRVFNKNDDLIAFAQRLCGYFLTGDVSEHRFPFLFGTGRNGKGVFCDTISYVLGDYATTSPVELFLESTHERHPVDEARLHKVRLTIAQEIPTGRAWNAAKVKNLTGGDKVVARFMRQDPIEFPPTHKLMIAGNTKPRLNIVDEAIRSRLMLVPFLVTIPQAERDPQLIDKLKTEAPQILRWMIDGCLDWQENGLGVPPTVREASSDYSTPRTRSPIGSTIAPNESNSPSP
jgi:putative DNA primase/helicase